MGGKCERIRDGNVKEIEGVKEIEIEIYKRDKKGLRSRNVKMIRKGGKCERDVREGGTVTRKGGKLIEKCFDMKEIGDWGREGNVKEIEGRICERD